MLAQPSDHSVARIALPRADANHFFPLVSGLRPGSEEEIHYVQCRRRPAPLSLKVCEILM